MPKWDIHATIVGSKYLGEVEADTEAEALKKGEGMCGSSLCHACSPECEDAEVDSVTAVAKETTDQSKLTAEEPRP